MSILNNFKNNVFLKSTLSARYLRKTFVSPSLDLIQGRMNNVLNEMDVCDVSKTLKRESETGRSMVEMLGTLAIMGVLSVGGIVGYSYAMNKYRASTTLNDVNLRMIDVVTQVSQDRTNLKLSDEWGTKGQIGYPISLFQNVDLEPSIMVEEVPSEVCRMILKDSANTQDIFVGKQETDSINGEWYQGDDEDICGTDDKKTMLFALNDDVLGGGAQEGKMCESNLDCYPDKPFCDAGVCKVCAQDSHCPSTLPRCDTQKGVCHECVSNDDCKDGYYCGDTNESPTKAKPYTCKRLNFSNIDLTNEENITETWYYSNEPMTWWDAKNACEAMDLRMPQFLEITTGENKPGWVQYFYVREHVKKLYSLLSDRPRITISNYCRFLGYDGYTPNCNHENNVTGFPNHSTIYGVCK